MSACRVKISPVTPRSCYPSDKRRYRHYTWNQDQSYEGEFFRDSLHGDGTYKWKHLGVYEGGFYSNYKEGYALMSFPDNSCFEGLFVGNQRFGPGIFTYSNGRQDAGFWVGGKLVRLSRSVDCIIPRLAPTPAAKIKLLQFRRLIPIDEEVVDLFSENYSNCDCPSSYLSCPYSSLIFDPRSYFFDKAFFEKTYFNSKYTGALFDDSQNWEVTSEEEEEEEEEGDEEKLISEYSSVPGHCLCPNKEFKMKYKQQSFIDVCEKEESKIQVEMGLLAYFTHYGMLQGLESKDEEESEGQEETGEVEEKVKRPKIVSWNRSELCTLMLKQIFRHRELEGKLTFNIAKLMLGARTAFRKTGEKEKQCLEFLKTCAVGPPKTVEMMLCEYNLSEELTDARGNNSVMFAAAADQHEIIDVLLDYGVDVNSFNDESLTPLNLCLLRRLAHAYDLGNWETAFLPNEVEKTEDVSQAEEWRNQVSIPSLDRIFGDGMSLLEGRDQHSQTFSREKSKSVITSELSSTSAMLMISKSLMNAGRNSLSRKSTSPAPPSVQSPYKIKTKIPPTVIKTTEFQKSVEPPKTDSYFFELAPQTYSEFENKNRESSRQFRRMSKEEDWEEMPGEGDFYNSERRKKLLEIDRTIEKLLKRGADPNISEVPKPSIHLGLYTKDWQIIYLLLSYGADPNSRLYSNEGLLTPLHVLVLLKSDLVYVDICDLLLNSGADPEGETLPEFVFYEEEKPFLSLSEGRTPLHLLCMRPDLEYADPESYLVKIALMLAKTCNKTHFYKGYSYLALAMWFGNIKLFKALLDSKYFDPNILLGNDMGTLLHVLVSTEFQKKTQFNTSIQICDYLLDAKANPLKRISRPKKLVGNCIDYGYREVEAEKALRKSLAAETKEAGTKDSGKKSSKKMEKAEKPEKFSERDHLTDHINVLEYLCKRVKEMKIKKKRGQTNDESTCEKGRSGQSTGLNKSGKEEWNASKTKTGKKVDLSTEVESQKGGKGKESGKEAGKDLEKDLGKDLGKYESELWKNGDQDDDDNDDDRAKRKVKKPKENGKGKKENGGGKQKGKESEKGKKRKPKKKADSTASKMKLKSFVNKSASAKQPCASETFPEKLRQAILKRIGNCTNLDVNELLLPYVVLRDGDLYYNIKGTGSRGIEQYSLV